MEEVVGALLLWSRSLVLTLNESSDAADGLYCVMPWARARCFGRASSNGNERLMHAQK